LRHLPFNQSNVIKGCSYPYTLQSRSCSRVIKDIFFNLT
jgi:hypothetical protein